MRIFFIAADEDLYPILDEIERKHGIKYVLRDSLPTPDFSCYYSYKEIPHLGKSSTDSTMGSDAYLIVPKETIINYRPVQWPDNEIVYTFDQISVPESVHFIPGGVWKDEAVIAGEFSSINNDIFTKLIAKIVKGTIKSTFYKRVGVYWVGNHAKDLYLEGKRLTTSTQSPRSYDLELPGIPKISSDDPEPVIVHPNFKEGEVFAIPLGIGGWVICVVARTKVMGLPDLILGYFFGPIKDALPNHNDIASLNPKHAVIVVRVSADNIVNGEWPFIGKLSNLNNSDWPYPDMFVGEGEYGTPSNNSGIIIDAPKSVMRDLINVLT